MVASAVPVYPPITNKFTSRVHHVRHHAHWPGSAHGPVLELETGRGHPRVCDLVKVLKAEEHQEEEEYSTKVTERCAAVAMLMETFAHREAVEAGLRHT